MEQTRICPECSATFKPTNGRQVFCTPVHKVAFHAVMRRRGQVAIPFLQVSRLGKNGRTDDTAYAFSQISALADQWNTEDKARGRQAVRVVAPKRELIWRAADVR